MTWTPDARNLLVVDSTHRQPDFVGWYDTDSTIFADNSLYPSDVLVPSGRNTNILPTPGLRANKGLITTFNDLATIRPGNGNDTITLFSHQAISSHPENFSTGRYATSIPVTAGEFYTFGVTAAGVNGSEQASVTTLKILWVSSNGSVISESVKGIRSAFGIRVRNCVTDIAPSNAVGAILYLSCFLTVTLSKPAFARGFEDIRWGEPEFIGDQWIGHDSNLFYVDPETGGSAWMTGWADHLGVKNAPNNGIVPIVAGGEARLYFQEHQWVPANVGIRIKPGVTYAFGIDEYPTRTDSLVKLRIYDITGTRLLQTINATGQAFPSLTSLNNLTSPFNRTGTNGAVVNMTSNTNVTTPGNTTGLQATRFKATFTAPAGAAYFAVKIIGGSVPTGFQYPTLVESTVEAGPLPPFFDGTVTKTFSASSDITRIVRKSFVSTSDMAGPVRLDFISATEVLKTVATVTVGSRSDLRFLVATGFISDTDVRDIVGISFESDSDLCQRLGFTVITKADVLKKVGASTLIVKTDLRSHAAKTLLASSDKLQVVGKYAVLDQGLTTSGTVLPGVDVLSEDSNLQRIAGPSLVFRANSDITKRVTKTFVVKSTVAKKLGLNFIVRSDVRTKVSTTVVANSDTRKRVGITLASKSTVNRKNVVATSTSSLVGV